MSGMRLMDGLWTGGGVRRWRWLLPLMLAAIGSAVASPGWIELFNGRDLAGWRENRFAHEPRWAVKDGILVGSGGQGYLVTDRAFGDFELTAEIRISDVGGARGNSGVYFRCQPHRDRSQEYPAGYEAQCDHFDENNPTGSIYNLGVSGARAPMPQLADGDWFTLRIVAEGNHLRTWVNGRAAADCRDPQNRYETGNILLQMHHRTGVVEFRHVRIRELSPGAKASWSIQEPTVVEAACGECKFGLEGDDCDLAIRIDGKSYFVDGVDAGSLGNAHAVDGICEVVRKAKVTGVVQDGRFKADSFELLAVESP